MHPVKHQDIPRPDAEKVWQQARISGIETDTSKHISENPMGTLCSKGAYGFSNLSFKPNSQYRIIGTDANFVRPHSLPKTRHYADKRGRDDMSKGAVRHTRNNETLLTNLDGLKADSSQMLGQFNDVRSSLTNLHGHYTSHEKALNGARRESEASAVKTRALLSEVSQKISEQALRAESSGLYDRSVFSVIHTTLM